MNIKLELLKTYITDFINNQIDSMEIDVGDLADTVAINILSEIKSVIKDSSRSDFDVIENIVRIFDNYGIDYGSRHDF